MLLSALLVSMNLEDPQRVLQNFLEEKIRATNRRNEESSN